MGDRGVAQAKDRARWSTPSRSETHEAELPNLVAPFRGPGILARWAPLPTLLSLAATPSIVCLSLYALIYGLGGTIDGQALVTGVVAALLASYLLKDDQDFLYRSRSAFRAALTVFWRWLLLLLALTGLASASGFRHGINHYILTVWAVVTPFSILSGRALILCAARHWPVSSRSRRTAVIVGASAASNEAFAIAIQDARILGSKLTLMGFFDDRSGSRISVNASDLLGTLEDVGSYVWTYHINIVFITLPMTSHPRVVSLLDSLNDTTASVYFVPIVTHFAPIQSRIEQFAGMPIISVVSSPFDGASGMLKRGFDLFVASALLVVASPIMLVITATVKLSSDGPIFFTQNRYGLDGHVIRVYKFRTMFVREDGDAITQAVSGDSRITALGVFLRKTSLDELPQLLNVIQGRMSLVGPRPHACTHNEQYRKLIRGYMLRHKVRPGITGLAQVNGFRGETQTLEKMRRRIECDLDYLRNWSLFLDIKIILKTIILILNDRNAY